MQSFIFIAQLVGFTLASVYFVIRMRQQLGLEQLTSDRRLIRLSLSSYATGTIVLMCSLALAYSSIDWLLEKPHLSFNSLAFVANVVTLFAILPAIWTCITLSYVHRMMKQLQPTGQSA